MASLWCEPWVSMCSMASSKVVHDFYREAQVEEFGGPIGVGGGDDAFAEDRAHGGVAAQFDAARPEGVGGAGQEGGGDVAVDEERFDRVADAGALGLRVDDEFDRHVQVGGAVHVEDANAVVVLDDGHAGVLDDGFDERLAAARHEQIDVFVHLCEVADGLAAGVRDEEDAVGGQTGGGRAVAQGVGDGEVGMDGLAAAAQDGGVALFSCKGRRRRW